MKLMILNVKQALRNLYKNGWQTCISVVGLVFGLVCFTFSLNWWWTETHYDFFRPDYRQLYVVQQEEDHSYSDLLSVMQAEVLRKQLGSSARTTVVKYERAYRAVDETGKPIPGTDIFLQQVPPDFIDFMGIRVLHGDVRKALATPGQKVLTAKLARHIFGREDVAGRQFHWTRMYGAGSGEPSLVTVGAVIADEPSESFLSLTALEGWQDDPETMRNTHVSNTQLFVRTHDADELEARIRSEKNDGNIRLMPMRLASRLQEQMTYWRAFLYPLAFLLMSVLLLIGAVFNLVAVLTTLFLGRLREYKLRITLGASFRSNVGWLGVEVVLLLAVSLFVSGIAIELISHYDLLPFNHRYVFNRFAWCALVLVVSTLLGLVYPILRLHRLYRRSMKGEVHTSHVHIGLLFVQLVVCALLSFVLVNAYRQLHRVFTADLGFQTENILRIDTHLLEDAAYQAFCERLRQGGSSHLVSVLPMGTDLFDAEGYGKGGFDGNMLSGIDPAYTQDVLVGEIFLPLEAGPFFGLKPRTGSWPDSLPTDGSAYCYVNQTFIDHFHAADHVQRTLMYWGCQFKTHGELDVRTENFKMKPIPLFYVLIDDYTRLNELNSAVYVKYRPGHRLGAEETVNRTVKELDLDETKLSVASFSDYVISGYSEDLMLVNAFSVLVLGSLVVTFLGVFSLMLYTLRIQRKSIAVRRVFGASYRDLCALYLRSYVGAVVVACVVAYPLGWYIIDYWMSGFTEQVGVGLLSMVVVCLLLLGLVGTVVLYQVCRAARENPADVVKSDS